MSPKKLPQQLIGMTLVLLFLIGCGAPAATRVLPTTTPTPPSTPTPEVVAAATVEEKEATAEPGVTPTDTLTPIPTGEPTAAPTSKPPTATATPVPSAETDGTSRQIVTYLDGARLTLERSPYIEDDIVFVPGREVFDALGYSTYIITNADEQYIGGEKYKADGSITKFHLSIGSRDGIIDPGLAAERRVPLIAPVRYEDSEVMIPLEFVAASANITTRYDTASQSVNIDTGRRVSNLSLQVGGQFNAVIFDRKTSDQLEDNRIGALASGLSLVDYAQEGEDENSHLSVSEQVECGIKRQSLTINNQDWEPENWDISEFEIHERYRPIYERLKQRGIELITYNLIFKDKDFLKAGGKLGYPRFKNEAEVERYLDFVRTSVRYFKGVVDYYEIWNEQNIQGTGQYIEPDDYIELVKRAIPIIREEDPAVKISVGQTTQFDDPASQAYMYRILESDLMPIVDAVALHPLFWDSPEHESEYYYAYPDLLTKVKETAWAHGFKGEFIGGEGNYSPGDRVPEDLKGRVPLYTKIRAGKYAARGNVTNLGLGFGGGIYGITGSDGPAYTMICNLSTVFAGAEPENVGVEIHSQADRLRQYGFSLPNRDTLIALWTDGVAEEEDAGEEVDIRIPGFSNSIVTAIDILNSTEQDIISTMEGDALVVENLLVKDYPIIVRLRPGN